MEGSDQECMACKKPISTEFIFIHTPKIFREEYVKKVVDLDLVKERALLKGTQERMDAQSRCKLLQKRLAVLDVHLRKCNDDEMRSIKIKSQEEYKRIYETILDKTDEEINNVSTTFFCPLNMCLGIVKKGKCNTCRKFICVKCREERTQGHECSKELLDTIRILRRDTKPCPRCKVPIHKIDGCDQMFCTKCKTPFSWRTLTIHTGIIHNPHYHEYIATLNRDTIPFIHANDPCGEELDEALREMQKEQKYLHAIRRTTKTNAIKNNNFIPRVLNEINAMLPILANDVYDDETIRINKQKFREVYLKQRLQNIKQAEINWRNKLKLMYKKRELKKDLIKLIELFERGLKDYIIIGYTDKNYDKMFLNIINLIEYFRNQLYENEIRHNLKNNTMISIDHGLQCRLIRY
jgi:hypothetical protein